MEAIHWSADQRSSPADLLTGQQSSPADLLTGQQSSPADLLTGQQSSPADLLTGQQSSPADLLTGQQSSTADLLTGQQSSPADLLTGQQSSPADLLTGQQSSPADLLTGQQSSPADLLTGQQSSPADLLTGQQSSPADMTGQQSSQANLHNTPGGGGCPRCVMRARVCGGAVQMEFSISDFYLPIAGGGGLGLVQPRRAPGYATVEPTLSFNNTRFRLYQITRGGWVGMGWGPPSPPPSGKGVVVYRHAVKFFWREP